MTDDDTGPRRANVPRQPARSEGAAAVAPEALPRFSRFSAAMDAARVANAPQFALYSETPPLDVPPVEAGASWRGAGGPVVRWVGIGSCVVLFGLLTATMLTLPIGATIERLIAAEVQAPPAAEAAAPPEPTAPALVEPAAGLADPPPRMPTLQLPTRPQPTAMIAQSPRVTALDAGRPVLAPATSAPPRPVPALKPPAAAR